MSIINLYEKLYIGLIKSYRLYCVKIGYIHYKKLMKRNSISTPSLTRKQKNKIKELWKSKGPFNYDTHKLVYWATGIFDEKIVPEKYIRLSMEIKLNNQLGKYAWADKNIFDLILPKDSLPKVLVRNIEGCLYDSSYNFLSLSEAEKMLKRYKRVFYKPAVDSGKGNGVQVLDCCNRILIDKLGRNWIIQEVLEVHPFLKKMNDTAVTIIRMVSFYIDGNVYITSASLRVGIEGAIKDYSETRNGDGCLIIGIDKNGILKEYGYYPSGVKSSKAPNGVYFGGMHIPHYQEAEKLIKEAHRKLPHYRFVAWDVTVDKNNRPVIIEYNIKGPGVLYYQYANGTLFGSNFNDIYKVL